MPPNIEWAERHGKANMIGIPYSILQKEIKNPIEEVKNICPCCGKTQVIKDYIIFRTYSSFL